MLEFSHGEVGWDVFTLEYKVDAPVDAVLNPDAMAMYGRMFNQLWRIKRIERAVTQAWRKVMTGSRTYLRVPGEILNTGEASFLYSSLIFWLG